MNEEDCNISCDKCIGQENCAESKKIEKKIESYMKNLNEKKYNRELYI